MMENTTPPRGLSAMCTDCGEFEDECTCPPSVGGPPVWAAPMAEWDSKRYRKGGVEIETSEGSNGPITVRSEHEERSRSDRRRDRR